MTRKDFEAIAASVKSTNWASAPFNPIGEHEPLSNIETNRLRAVVAVTLADTLVQTSDSFDPERFVRDCGVHSNVLSAQGIRAHSDRLNIRMAARR